MTEGSTDRITHRTDADVDAFLDGVEDQRRRDDTRAATELIREVTVGRALLIVEHDMKVVFSLSDRISVLVYGEVIATGTPAEIRANAAVKEAYLGEEVRA